MKKLIGFALFLLAVAGATVAQELRITNVVIYDGSGTKPYKGSIRVRGDEIVAAGRKLAAKPGESVLDGRGLALAPGFIDMHSHTDRGIFESRPALNVVRQGITTVLVGQDGGSVFPLRDFFARLEREPAGMNVASMAGHASIRRHVMKDTLRASTPAELERMRALLEEEMQAGAMGISTGLEYDDGQFATTDELVELSKVAARHGGFYISHMRDEGNGVFKSLDEIIEIGKRSGIRVQTTHIKLGTTPVWHLAAKRMPAVFARARREGVDLKADVYPYTYWQSNLRVIVLDRDYFNPAKVEKALAENGGAAGIILARYELEPALAGKTIEQVAATWKVTPVEAYMRLVKATMPDEQGNAPDHGVIGESMHEDDVRWFIAASQTMFCTDGELHGRHPRGAGAFPRILGRYVREQKVLPLARAIRKATAMPAAQLGLRDRGRIAAGYKADLVLFDPARVIDGATIAQPEAPPQGVVGVMVNGVWVVQDEKTTNATPGRVLRRAAR